jgi:ParB family chromosome partitioning protein
MNVVEIPITSLYVSSKNVRKTISVEEETDIVSLARDIESNGLLSPLCVREDINGSYEVFAGQRRLQALKMLDVDVVPCIIYDKDTTDEDIENLSFSENNQRNAMNQKDKCMYYHKLFTQLGSIEAVAKKVHVKAETVEKYIKVKEFLVPELLDNLDKKGMTRLTMDVANQLAKVEKKEQVKVFQEIKDVGSTKQKLDMLRIITDAPPPKKKTVTTTVVPVVAEAQPVIIPLITNRPWIYNDKQEKIPIPEALWGEIQEIIYDYLATEENQ